MKINSYCSECSIETNEGLMYFEISNSRTVEMKCSKGHIQKFLHQRQLYELLFDMGAMAMLDGYFIEAVASFTSALERFYQFCIEVMLFHSGVNIVNIKETWSLVSVQSERQLGAYYFLYLNLFNKKPNEIDQYKVGKKSFKQFRNDCVHKGYIPNQEEAFIYGKGIYDYIMPLLIELRNCCGDSFDMPTVLSIGDGYNRFKDGDSKSNISHIYFNTMINITVDSESFEKIDFEEALINLRYRIENRHYIKSSFNKL